MLAVGNDKQYQACCAAAGARHLRKTSATGPMQGGPKRAALITEIEKLCRKRTTKDSVEGPSRANVPCGPIDSIAEVFEDPQVKHRRCASTCRMRSAGAATGAKSRAFLAKYARLLDAASASRRAHARCCQPNSD